MHLFLLPEWPEENKKNFRKIAEVKFIDVHWPK
jgi:hypothetical protein